MSLLSELLDELNKYLTGGSSGDRLEDWVVGHLQLILDSRDTRAIGIANEIDACFVELGEGIIDLAAFNDRLSGLAYQSAAAS